MSTPASGRLADLTLDGKRDLLARLLERRAAETGARHPLSHGQQALWFLHRLAPDSSAYNVAWCWWIRSDVDADALRAAFQGLVDRHAVLRTTYFDDDGEPGQCVHPHGEAAFDVVEAGEWDGTRLSREVEGFAGLPFDLVTGPVLRVRLFRRFAGEHVLAMVFHHIAYDLWSGMHVLGDLRELYGAALERRAPRLPTLETRYVDYVRWQRRWLESPASAADWSYWKEHLSGGVPTLDLPTDRPRPPVQSYHGASYMRPIRADLAAKVFRFAHEERVTPYTLVLSAFLLLLRRYAGQEQVMVGSPMAGRSRPGFDKVVGYFLNTLPLRADVSGNPPYREFLRAVRATTLDALSHQDFPVDMIAERLQRSRDPSRASLFQVLFVYNRAHSLADRSVDLSVTNGGLGFRIDMGKLVLETFETESHSAMVDVALTVHEDRGKLLAAWQYCTDLFEEPTVARMARHLEVLLEDLVDRPDAPIEDLRILSAEEEREMVHDWNAPGLPGAPEGPLTRFFDRWVEDTPEAEAVVAFGERLSYAALDARANRLAHELRERGVGPGASVGLQLDRSTEMVVAVLAVLKAGGAYVPMDPSYPEERLRSIRSDTGMRILVTRSDLMSEAPVDVEVLQLDADAGMIAARPATGLTPVGGDDDPAYILYTSGSTGRPKGVVVSRRNLIGAYLAWERAYRLMEDGPGGHLQSARFSFDVCTGDIVRALFSGGHLVLLNDEALFSPADLYDLMRREGVRYFELVPAAFRPLLRWLEETGNTLDFVRIAIVGADSWYVSEYERTRAVCGPRTRVLNSYGVTEATIDSCFFEGSTEGLAEDDRVPIGRPLANTRIHILDRWRHPVPVCVTGELYVGGPAVSLGYLDRPDLTSERFVADPFEEAPGARLYRTGDLACYDVRGDIHLLGRADDQVKLRGFRIELQEIEAALRRVEGVASAVVTLREDEPGNKRLVAYWCPVNGTGPTWTDLVGDLRAHLPEYMIPSTFVPMASLPLSANGKVDRAALPPPDRVRPALGEAFVAPRTPLERAISSVWMEALGVDRVGVHDNFFDLGGNSLLVIQVRAHLVGAVGRDLPVVALFQHPTVATLAAFLERPETARPRASSRVRSGHERAVLRKTAMGRREAVQHGNRGGPDVSAR